MEEFMASSPPAWNANIPRPPSVNNIGQEEMDWEEDVDQEIQDIPNAHFDVLDSSLPKYGSQEESTLNAANQYMAQRAASALLDQTPPFVPEKQLGKPKWHFGIRSRSPPMEVMLEIYKTLASLGMEWRRKDGIALPEIGLAPAGGYPEDVDAAIEQWTAEHGGVAPRFGQRAPPKKELSAQEKAAQGLYHVETRAQYGDVVVRMDLQLYRVDGANYLVDFRNIGYYRKSSGKSLNPEDVRSVDLTEGEQPPDTSIDGLPGGSVRNPGLSPSNSKEAAAGLIGGVSGPFHFLEMACQLIAELANG